MSITPASLPCPNLYITLEVPTVPEAEIDFLALPARPGVFAFEDDSGGTLALAITANLRRLIKVKLQPLPADESPSRRINFRESVRMVRAVGAGSLFEAEWIYLQLARERLPLVYQSMLDRWRGWFVEIDPEAPFPRWVKSNQPVMPTRQSGIACFGPIVDKHAAGRCLERLEDLFDLCRYHHILCEAPNANACAYKEMGRCPAPCDGTISLEAYREMIVQSIAYLQDGGESWRAEVQEQMQRASEDMQFERASELKRKLEVHDTIRKADVAWLRPLDAFRFLGVYPSEQKDWTRLFLVLGDRIEPWAEVPNKLQGDDLKRLTESIEQAIEDRTKGVEINSPENLGLVCRHLFMPRAKRKRGELMRLEEALQANKLAASLRRISKSSESENDRDDSFADQMMQEMPDAGSA